MGYVFCGMMGTHIVSYLLVMFYISLKSAIKKCKRKRFIEGHKKRMIEGRHLLKESTRKRKMVRSFINRLKQDRNSLEPVRIEKIDVKRFANTFEGLSEIVTVDLL